MQKYDPALAPDAPYAFTFDLFGMAFARILSTPDTKNFDLADLYNHPWDYLKRAGYTCIGSA
jgi:hypothetical protein